MGDPNNVRPFSDDPYSDLPLESAARPDPQPRRSAIALGVLCAEAQADGVPCFELGRDCETCERAFRSRTRGRRAES